MQNRKRLAFVAAAAFLITGAPASAQNRVGVTAAVNPAAQVERGPPAKTIVIGENVLFQDRIVTSDEGLVQVLFVDGSTFTVGPNARVVVDEFVYDPATGSGELVASVTSGALRFVGGKLSKRGNNVRFNLPVGTIGVRGGIANFDLSPPCSNGTCPTATASLVFGDQLVLSGNGGQNRRIHQPGYSFTFFGPPGDPTVNIVPTITLDQSSLQARLSGRTGRSGGTNTPPEEGDVLASGIIEVNSQQAPSVILPPRKPIVESKYAPDSDVPGIQNVTNVLESQVVNTAQGDTIRDDVIQPIEPDELPTFVYFTPDTLQTSDGTIDDPGRVNILTPVDPDFVPAAVVFVDGRPVSVRIGADVLDVPASPGESPIEPFFSNTANEEVEGLVYRGPDNFLFFYLQPADGTGGQEVATLIFGEATPVDAILSTGGATSPGGANSPGVAAMPPSIRVYELQDDYEKRNRGISSRMALLNPLIAREFGSSLAKAAETPYYIAERSEQRDFANTLYAALLIEGQGADQRSAVNIDTSSLNSGSNGDSLNISGARRGSYRLDAQSSSVSMRGGISTVATQTEDGQASFFGENGENFVYSSSVANDPDGGFFDRQQSGNRFLQFPEETTSSTQRVAQLVSETSVGEFERPAGTINGFAAGVFETVNGANGYRSTAPDQFRIDFLPQTSTLGGYIIVNDTTNSSEDAAYRLPFGIDPFDPGQQSSTRGTYVDRDNFAATASGPPNTGDSPGTLLVKDDGEVLQDLPGRRPGTYMVSADAVPQPQIFSDAGVTECECRFMEWGWWGTDARFEDPAVGTRVDHAHLGTWVAGDLTDSVDVPTFGTGRYRGHAVGNVVNGTSGTTQQYVATGDMSLDFDFSERTGTLAITNFDGRDFSGSMFGGGSAGQFAGSLSGSGLFGTANGAFAEGPKSPVQGVLGAFDVNGADYQAVGTFLGER